MKRFLMGGVAMFLIAAFLVPNVVQAQDDAAADTITSTAADEATDQATTKAADRQARITEYKQQVTDRLTAVQEARIAGACAAAQAKVTALQANLSAAIEKRRGTYADVSAKLAEVVKKLQAASVDTTELEAALVQMDTQAAAVVTAAETYRATLADLSEMDCAADPSGFKAALTVAREQRAALVSQAQALKEYVTVNVKEILQAIREQLAGTEV